MRNYVIINGVNSLTIKGLAINELPPIVKAPMRVLQEEIDGRDGDIITDLGYGAYDKIMTIGLYDGYDINEIIAFFNEEGTIVFSDEADKYYNFKIIEQIDYERLIKFRTASITFHCQPFKYPLTETPVEITNEYVEAEGTSITLTPTAEAPISIDLKGNTQQDSTTGKQYFNANAITNTNIVVQDNGKTIIMPVATSGNGYTTTGVKLKNLCPNLKVDDVVYLNFTRNLGTRENNFIYLENPYTNTWTNGTSKTITQNMLDSNVVLYGNRYGSGETGQCILTDFRITPNSTDTYEPFTNGASPNPDYPQEIHNVSGDNTIEICGKNLFNAQIQEGTYGDAVYTIGSDGLITQSDTDNSPWNINQNRVFYLSAGTYTISILGTHRYLQLRNLTDNNDIVVTPNNKTTFTLNDRKAVALKTYGTASGLTYPVSYYIQIEKGSTSSEYEAYTGQSQLISLGVENLFDKANITSGYRISATGDNYIASGYYISSFIKVKSNTIYTKNSPTADAYHRVAFYTSNSIRSFISVKDDNNTFTTPSNCQYIRFCGLQTELDTTAMTKGNHIQYISDNPIELCKIGNYQDYIYKTDKWYLHKEIGKYVLTGGENETWQYNSTYTFFWTTSITNIDNQPVYTNYYLYNSSITGITGSYGCSVYQNTFRIKNTDYTQPSDLKTWLSTHNTIVYYVLATPTNTEITNSTLIYQLEATKNMTSYDGTTNISQENNDEPFIIKAKAMKQGSGTATITNSGNIYSKPTIDIEGTGIVDVYIGANQIFSVNVDEEVIIDSTNLEAYKPDGTLANRNVTGNIANLKLPTGNSTIKVDGDITKATITNYTRWL